MKPMLCLLLLLGAIPAFAQQDRPAIHGMLVFGQQHIYASHLPMFHAPHHYQVLLQLSLPSKARRAYLHACKRQPDSTVYTLAPEPFVLPATIRAGARFRAVLYQGHFERGGRPITDTFQVAIATVYVFDTLSPQPPPDFINGYYLLGTRQEAFLIHRIGARPSYDHVLRVQPPLPFFNANYQQPQTCTLLPMAVSEPLPANILVHPNYSLRGQALVIQPLRQVYLEWNDLK